MLLDSRKVSEEILEGSLGSLGGCLVEGNPEQRRRERRLRRSALVVSILIQTATLALLILLPLFGKTEHVALAIPTPIPPYSPYTGSSPDPGAPHPHRHLPTPCHFCRSPDIPPIIVTHDTARSDEGPNAAPQGLGQGIPGAPGDLIPIPDARSPLPPPPVAQPVARPTVVRRRTSIRRCCFTALTRFILLCGNRFTRKVVWSSMPGSRRMARCSFSKLSAAIPCSSNRPSKPCASGATGRRF